MDNVLLTGSTPLANRVHNLFTYKQGCGQSSPPIGPLGPPEIDSKSTLRELFPAPPDPENGSKPRTNRMFSAAHWGRRAKSLAFTCTP